MLSIFRRHRNLFVCKLSKFNIAQFEMSQLMILRYTGQLVLGYTNHG